MALDCRPAGRQQGVALVTILLVLAVLATLAIYSAEDQDLAIRRVTNLITAEQGYQVNISGEQWVVKVLENDMDNDRLNANGQQPVTDHAGEVWGNLGPPVEVGETGMTLWMRVEDLQGRFNLNNLLENDAQPGGSGQGDGQGDSGDQDQTETGVGQQARVRDSAEDETEDPDDNLVVDAEENQEEEKTSWLQILRNLLAVVQLNPELSSAVKDWIDADEQTVGTTGAEDLYYTGLDIPYRTPNRIMASTAELAEIKDVDVETLTRLSPWVTALPVGGGDPVSVNVNTAPATVLAAFAADQPLDPQALEPLVVRRQSTPFESVEDFQSEFEALVASGLVPGFGDMLSVASDFYAGRSCAQSGRVKFSMTSLMQKKGADNNVKVLQRERFFGCPAFPQPGEGTQ